MRKLETFVFWFSREPGKKFRGEREELKRGKETALYWEQLIVKYPLAKRTLTTKT